MGRPRKIQSDKMIVINENATLKWRNELVNGRYSLSLLEMRMVIALSGHLEKNADNFICGSISVKDLGKFIGIGEDECYKKIKTLAYKLQNRVLFFEWYATSTSKKKSWLTTGWFDFIMYDNETSSVIYQFGSLIAPMLLKVQQAYVQLQCKPLMAFRCMYSNRFLLMFLEWERIQPRTIAIDELRDLFQLGDKYKYFKDFRKCVVDPAIQEINAFSDFVVTANPQKSGRSYTHYIFYIRRKTKAELQVVDTPASGVDEVTPDTPETADNGLSEEQKAVLKELIGYGISKKMAEAIVKDLSLDVVKNNIAYTKSQDKQGKVRNFASFLVKAIKKNYWDTDSSQNKLTPEQKAEQDKLKEQTRQAVESLKHPNRPADSEEVKKRKEDIKNEILNLSEDEQQGFMDYIRQLVANSDNQFAKRILSFDDTYTYNNFINGTALHLTFVINEIYKHRYGDDTV